MEHIYNIPNWNKNKFEKYIKSLKRKGLNVKCEEVGQDIITVDNVGYMCTTYSIESEILYQEEGWQFIGTIEHKENGNIIRKAVDVEVPERYYTAPNECEHCHTIRNRIDTYLVRHIEDNEFKQVGKSCLKAYTGLNPALCTLCMTLDSELMKMEMDEEEVVLGGYNTYGSYRGYYTDVIKAIAYMEIQKHGYKKEPEYNNFGGITKATKDKVIDLYYIKDSEKATPEQIADVDNWVANLDTQYNDYFRNAKVAYENEFCEPRDLGLITSLISCYFRAKAKEAEKAAKIAAQQKAAEKSQEVGYLGNIGDKVTFTVASDYILFKNEPFTYYGSWSYTHKIIDTEGHTILWSTSADTSNDDIFPAGTIIKGTVKAQKEFRGELQTIITRGKLI